MEKLTLEKFIEIKNKLLSIISQAKRLLYGNDYFVYLDDEEILQLLCGNDLDDNMSEFLNRYYIPVQSALYNYDLSDIPFEEWKGLILVGSYYNIADFSNTKANIDFNLIKCNGLTSFKGCNIRNIDSLNVNCYPRMFDEKVVNENSKYFLSNLFNDEFKKIYYDNLIDITHLLNLSSEQINELEEKNWIGKLYRKAKYKYMLKNSKLGKLIGLYKRSKEEYETIGKILEIVKNEYSPAASEIIDAINTSEIDEIKNKCFSILRKNIMEVPNFEDIQSFPEMFIKENPDLYLEGVNIPNEVKEDYFKRELSIYELVNYFDAFKNIIIDEFMGQNALVSIINRTYGPGKLQELMKKHMDVFKHLMIDLYDAPSFTMLFYDIIDYKNHTSSTKEDLETVFIEYVKEYICRYNAYEFTDDGYENPHWLSSINFKYIGHIDDNRTLQQCDDMTIVLDDKQRAIINILGLENMKRLETEIGFFFRTENYSSLYRSVAEALKEFFCSDRYTYNYQHKPEYVTDIIAGFKNGKLPYEEFLDMFANCLDTMREYGYFNNFTNYGWIQGKFRNDHPEIFMHINAPNEFTSAFYTNSIDLNYIYIHKEIIPYLLDKNLSKIFHPNIKLIDLQKSTNYAGYEETQYIKKDFISEYVKRHGNEKLLNLFATYGSILQDITIENYNNEIENENDIEKAVIKAIYNKVISGIDGGYRFLSEIPEFASSYPELFVDFTTIPNLRMNELMHLNEAYYTGNLTCADIKSYPKLVNLLKGKNLKVAFHNKKTKRARPYKIYRDFDDTSNFNEYDILNIFGDEKFLELCNKYGGYLDEIFCYFDEKASRVFKKIYNKLSEDDGSSKDNALIERLFKETCEIIEATIIDGCRNGIMPYYDDATHDFLKEKCPELFLSNDAPAPLKERFYCKMSIGMSFTDLKENKNWLPYLKGKALKTSLLRPKATRKNMKEYFGFFGDEKAIKLGISRAETVDYMITAGKIEEMWAWYEKTGEKFIPDYVVMQNFRPDEMDKFLNSASNWSSLMRIKSFALNPEAREAMLKLAYCFGAFDHDQKGMKKLIELLTDIPKRISSENAYVIYNIKSMIDRRKNNYRPKSYVAQVENERVEALKDAIKSDNLAIDFNKDIISQIYRKNDDGSYTLIINPQNCPKTVAFFREEFDGYRQLPIISTEKAHRLFGGFDLKYDPEFREFLLANIDKVLYDSEDASLLSAIQKNFLNIKILNSNRSLTWDLAVSYVKTNKYNDVHQGSEGVAEVSSIAGYTQSDFDKLQQIYNYGRQRTFSSIPRIKNTKNGYTYEMLRLDDPLAMAIGTLTDCCQELNNCAEVCMEHSMVDKNGRIFVIKDEKGNIIAQSWVWRNKDVICFDNIEIPDKVFSRYAKEKQKDKKEITQEIYDIYKQAARELIIEDEKEFKKLLESGKITQQQYDGLRVGKVTVGLGYNDIADSIKKNTSPDRGYIVRPLPFDPPVGLNRGLYTSDSSTQYILEKIEHRKKIDGGTLAIHRDKYIEYDDTNFTEKLLLSLEKLEVITKNNPSYLDTSIDDYSDSTKIVSAIAENYDLNADTTKIILTPNFAIIYDTDGDKVTIGELLFNTDVYSGREHLNIEESVAIQIRMALEQIASGKEVDISALNKKQKSMYNKAIGLKEELDIDSGISYSR